MNPAWLGVIIPVAIAAGTALSGYMTSRRGSSGRVHTSEADELWEQTRDMMHGLRQDKERAENQRDKLMDMVQTQMMPALEAITKGHQHIVGLLTEMAGRIEKS
jgi:hypothetical protein